MKRQTRDTQPRPASSDNPSDPQPLDPAIAQAKEAARLLLSPETVADRLELSRATIYRMLGRGELRSIKIGAARRIPARELEAYIEAHAPSAAS